MASAPYDQSEGQGLITRLSGAVRSQTLCLGLRFPPRQHVDAPDRLHTIPVQSHSTYKSAHSQRKHQHKLNPTLTHIARVCPSRARSADARGVTSCKRREKQTLASSNKKAQTHALSHNYSQNDSYAFTWCKANGRTYICKAIRGIHASVDKHAIISCLKLTLSRQLGPEVKA